MGIAPTTRSKEIDDKFNHRNKTDLFNACRITLLGKVSENDNLISRSVYVVVGLFC
jgi:hypothetical protein